MPNNVRSRKTLSTQRYRPPLPIVFSTPPLNRRFLPFVTSSCRPTKTIYSISSFYSSSEASPNTKRIKITEEEEKNDNLIVGNNIVIESAETVREPAKNESVVRNEENGQEHWIKCGEQSILIETALNTDITDRNNGFDFPETRDESVEFFRMLDTPIDDGPPIYETPVNSHAPPSDQIQEGQEEVAVETSMTIAGESLLGDDRSVLQSSPYRFIGETGIMLPPKRQPGYDLNLSLHRAAEQRRQLSKNRNSQASFRRFREES